MTSEKWKDCSSAWWWLKRTSDGNYLIGGSSRKRGIVFFFFLQKVERNCMKGQAKNRVPESALNFMTLVAYHDFVSEYSHLKGMSYDWGSLSRKASESTENISSSLYLFTDHYLLVLYFARRGFGAKIWVSVLNILILQWNLLLNEADIIMTIRPSNRLSAIRINHTLKHITYHHVTES